MDQIKQFLLATGHRWNRLRPQQRRRTRFAFLLCGAILGAWGIYQVTPRYELILSGRQFSERELTVIESALAQADLDEYRVVDGQVRVPRHLRAAYIGALASSSALPNQFDFELKDELSRSNPFESQEQRRARLQTTQQRELALILRAMNGIEDATIHLDESVSGPFGRKRRMTAMVVVRPESGEPLDFGIIRSIRQLVASAKVDLTPQDVTVTDLETGMSYAGDIGDPALIRSDEFAVRRMAYQRDWQRKISRLLAHVPGVQVAVNVDLEYKTKSAASNLQEAANPSHTVLVPSDVGVAIGIPEAFYKNVYREHRKRLTRVERAQESGESLDRVRSQQNQRVTELVKQVLPADAIVNVASVQDTPSSLAAAKDDWSFAGGLPFGWQTIAFALLSLGTLSLLCWNIASESRGQGSREKEELVADRSPSRAVETAGEMLQSQEIVMPAAEEEAPVRPAVSRDEFHQELTRIVRQDPDAAAAKLAEWIDKAA
jgi:flagellar biosynthesis/type III secretory pathway M-ring protein FliF/YscJ